jgi:hypothetical protein
MTLEPSALIDWPIEKLQIEPTCAGGSVVKCVANYVPRAARRRVASAALAGFA